MYQSCLDSLNLASVSLNLCLQYRKSYNCNGLKIKLCFKQECSYSVHLNDSWELYIKPGTEIYWLLSAEIHAICNGQTSYKEWNISKRTTLERCNFWWNSCHSNRAWVVSVEIIMGWVMAEWHGSLFEWVEWMLVSQAACVLVFSPRIIPMHYGTGD